MKRSVRDDGRGGTSHEEKLIREQRGQKFLPRPCRPLGKVEGVAKTVVQMKGREARIVLGYCDNEGEPLVMGGRMRTEGTGARLCFVGQRKGRLRGGEGQGLKRCQLGQEY